ncbi:hypothetical protein AKJ35_00005 [candidate division MSBL1 archaeon SCGC-AAA833F18]|uniref:Uncharacterized protein n=1 Tax=candidate division MSBL1 archaeon SCGC-AAA833F18 TaxID=1698257 RepID=A0A133VTA4_9EURY|nr:hypothetical protein AKJ35_00005 [candidate division MSBL1 archaeon SCGC-AAA833F18]
MPIWVFVVLAYCIIFVIAAIIRVRSELPSESTKVVGTRHRARPETRGELEEKKFERQAPSELED